MRVRRERRGVCLPRARITGHRILPDRVEALASALAARLKETVGSAPNQTSPLLRRLRHVSSNRSYVSFIDVLMLVAVCTR